MIDASNRAGKSPVVTVYKSRKRKSSGSDSISPGPYPYPPMGGHYTTPYIQEHYGMYSNYHNDISGSTTQQHPHYSPRSYGCPSDQHSMGGGGTSLPSQTSCAPMRPHPTTYGAYRTSPVPTPQSPYIGHTHPSMMQSNGPNLHGYHQSTHPPSLSAYAPPPPHPYATHDNLTSHGVMDMHNA